MRNVSTVPKRLGRASAFLAARFLFGSINPTIFGNRAERLTRKLGFFQAPTPAEVVANYLRGFVLFGRSNPYGPWFHWFWAPTRAVILPETANVPRNMRRLQRQGQLQVHCDRDVETIVQHCLQGREGWLTPEAADVYLDMHKLGLIASVGVYREDRLVGGLWGLTIGRVLAIMSLFHLENHAGALAFATVAEIVAQRGRWQIADCGTPNPHWERYGAVDIPVRQFSEMVTMNVMDNAAEKAELAALPELQRKLS